MKPQGDRTPEAPPALFTGAAYQAIPGQLTLEALEDDRAAVLEAYTDAGAALILSLFETPAEEAPE